MLELGVKVLIAYLLGTLMGSLILGRLRGVDIRNMAAEMRAPPMHCAPRASCSHSWCC